MLISAKKITFDHIIRHHTFSVFFSYIQCICIIPISYSKSSCLRGVLSYNIGLYYKSITILVYLSYRFNVFVLYMIFIRKLSVMRMLKSICGVDHLNGLCMLLK